MISSVGLEHYLDRVGVTGSNPVSPTMTKKIFLTPIVILGIIFIVLGLRWMLVDEPWMLDKVANEERLNMTFDQLFNEEINETLPGYLKQIYRFFGLWVCIIGLFIVSFALLMLLKIPFCLFAVLLPISAAAFLDLATCSAVLIAAF